MKKMIVVFSLTVMFLSGGLAAQDSQTSESIETNVTAQSSTENHPIWPPVG